MRAFLLIAFLAVWCGKNSFAQDTSKIQLDTLKKEKDYFLFTKTEKIATATFSKDKKSQDNIIYIYLGIPLTMPESNVVKGTVIGGKSKAREELPQFEKIDILSGKYEDIKVTADTKFRNLYALTGLTFPLRLKLHSGTETIDFELLVPGKWNIRMELKNN